MAIKFLSDINADGSNTDINADGAIKISDTTILETDSTYTKLRNPEGSACLELGDGGDRTNFYNNNTHRFRSFGGSTEYMRISSTGKVGIGTTTPHRLLDVRNESGTGEQVIAGTTGATLYFRPNTSYSSGGNFGIFTTGLTSGTYESTMTFKGYGSGVNDVMTLKGLGNVGIGTTSPTAPLAFGKSVYGAEDSENYFRIKLQDQGGIHNDVGIGQPASGAMGFNVTAGGYFSFNNGTSGEIARFNGTGLGIGTTNPVQKLDVSGAIKASSYVYTNELRANSDSGSRIVIHDGAGNIEFKTQSGTERMTIAYGGNVGIGVAAPESELHVHGTGNYTASGKKYHLILADDNAYGINNGGGLVFRGDYNSSGAKSNFAAIKAGKANANNGNANAYLSFLYGASGTLTEGMRIKENGDVGIGTISPVSKLHVYKNDSSTTRMLMIDQDGTGDATLSFRLTGVEEYALGIDNSDGDKFKISSGDAVGSNDRLTIDTTGNVGIGTANPSALLHVAGAIKTTGDVTMSSNTTLHIGNVDLTTGSGGNTVSVEAATSSGTAMNFKTSSGTVAAYMVYQGTTTTRFAGRVEPSGNRTLDLGTDALRWRVVYCETLDSAGQHESNLQDREQPVGQYITGTVLAWKNGKNRPCTQFADHMRMGIAVLGQDSPLVQGAEPVLCTGIVEEGDYLVTSEKEGHAVAVPRHIVKEQLLFDCVIGKALQDGEGESHLIKTWINI